MTDRKFKCYKTLRERLLQKSVSKPGSHASYFFKVFVLGDSKIYKNSVLHEGLISPGYSFSEWRDNLVQLNILVFDYDHPKSAYFQPGFEIVDLINQEKSSRSPMATENFVRSELKEVKDLLMHVINTFDPPYSDEKLKQYKKNLVGKEPGKRKISLNEDEEDEDCFDYLE